MTRLVCRAWGRLPLWRGRWSKIDRANRVVYSNTSGVPYDALVIATGSAPFIIPVPGKDLPGVCHLPRP
jgi:NAD(P)H-nitrite reductase large subunit